MCAPDCSHAENRDAARRWEDADRDAARRWEDADRDAERLPRRAVLGASAGVAASLAGCLGTLTGDGETPTAISLGEGLDCDVCGMVIEQHPGPNAQVFYDGDSPEGHDNPARFDSLKQCFFPYRLEREQLGWDLTVAYVTDYSSVDYDVSTQGGTTTISSHVASESFARAADLQYVVNSEVEGAMGPDFVPFSEQADAESFADEYGGEVVAYDDIGEGLVGQ